jgi:tRNA threonylcarbamoyl adenosine modification protein (Sua5/YciO/YrdC/YwlC family)
MRVVTVNPNDPREDRLAEAVTAIEAGEVVALPTETFYGLACDAFNEDALHRINELKRKPASSPNLLMISDPAQVETVSDTVPERFHELTAMFWPGPLTLVVKAAPRVPDAVTGGGGKVAVRVPGLALPRRIARALGRPISGPSANLHGQPACRTALEVAEAFGEGLGMILDGGSTAAGKPSTILDLTGPVPRLLREGILPASSLEPFLPELKVSH